MKVDICMSESLSRLGERKIIEFLNNMISDSPHNIVGNVDDAAIYNIGYKKYLVVSIDRIPISHGLRYEIVDYLALGKYFACSVINDVIAKGAQPFALLISLGLSPQMTVEELGLLYKGISDITNKYQVAIIGGDTKRKNTFDIVGTAIGLVDKDYFIPRNGAKIGDIIALTGSIGLFGANIAASLHRSKTPSGLVTELKVEYNKGLDMPFTTMETVSRSRAANAAIDISDGFLGDILKMVKSSNVGAEINYEKIPFPNCVWKLAKILNVSPLAFAAIGGDLQVALTVKRNKWLSISSDLEAKELKLHAVGNVVDKDLIVSKNGKNMKIHGPVEWEWFMGLEIEDIFSIKNMRQFCQDF